MPEPEARYDGPTPYDVPALGSMIGDVLQLIQHELAIRRVLDKDARSRLHDPCRLLAPAKQRQTFERQP